MKARYVWILALVGMLGAGTALADTLYVGTPYNNIPLVNTSNGNETVGGGSIQNSTLNGAPLNWLYCVDLYTTISVPGTYYNTNTTTDGTVRGLSVTNAGQVAWLLDHYATADIGDATGQIALQAAIWHVIYGVGLDPNSSSLTDYNNYLAALGSNTDSVSNVLWFSPGWDNGKGGTYQGLVGQVPDGGVTLLLLGGALVGLETLRRRLHV